MATNEILDRLREHDKREEFKELCDTLAKSFAAGSAQRAALEKLYTDKFAKDDKDTRVKADIKFNYVTLTVNDWTQQMRAKGTTPEMGNHVKEIDNTMMMNINDASYLLDEEDHARIFLSKYREANPNDTTPDKLVLHKGLLEARDHNVKRMKAEQQWVPLRREKNVDNGAEDRLVRLQADKTPDWYATVRNLQKYGEDHGYDEVHYKNFLTRIVSHFNAPLRAIIEDMEASELATFLSNLTLPESKYEILENEIRNLQRTPRMRLRVIMSQLKALATRLYDDKTEEERRILLERQMKIGLMIFTTGQTRKNLEASIDMYVRDGKQIKFDQLIEGAEESEARYGTPDQTLSFNSTMQQSLRTFNVSTKVKTAPHTNVDHEPKLGLYDHDFSSGMFQSDDYSMFGRRKKPLGLADDSVEQPAPEPPAGAPAGAAGAAGGADATAAPQREKKKSKNPRLPDGSEPAVTRSGSASSREQDQEFLDASSGAESEQEIHVNKLSVLVAKIEEMERNMKKKDVKEKKRSRSSERAKTNNSDYRRSGSNQRSDNRRESQDNRQNRRDSRENRQNRGDKRDNRQDRRQSRDNRQSRSSDSRRSDYRSSSRSTERSNSRDSRRSSNNRGRSQDRNVRSRNSSYSSNRSGYSRSNSRDRNSRNSRNDRDTRSTGNRRDSRSRQDRSSSRNRRDDRRSSRNSDRRRSSDRNSNWSDSDMEKGINCSRDYDPKKEKRCLKCMKERDHHEYKCPTYMRRSKFNCRNCNAGFHFPEECSKEPAGKNRLSVSGNN